MKLTPEVEAIIRAVLAAQNDEGDEDMTPGQVHAERRVAQARAAAKPRLKKKHSKATRKAWKKEI